MIQRTPSRSLPELFEADETAWLERMSQLAAEGDTGEMDLANLSEFLSDMARRDKREVLRRLATLLTHVLKWEHQPQKRTRSWELTIQEQREELRELLESATLRNYAATALEKAYQRAVRRAAVETDLNEDTFPVTCACSLEQLVTA
jgi:hypothetical protein